MFTGLIEEMTGSGLGMTMVRSTAFDRPPPGAGLKTVICAVPAAGRSLAGMAAVNCVVLTNVVGRSLPFQRTTDPWLKPLPVTVSVRAAPVGAVAGDSVLTAGTGLVKAQILRTRSESEM